MHARITEFRLLPGKLNEFKRVVDSLLPMARQQAGMRALVVLRTPEHGLEGVTVVSVWDSVDAMRASEKNMYFYQALARIKLVTDGIPIIREHEVIATHLAPALHKETA